MTRKEEIYQKAEELYQDVYPSSMAQRHGMEGIDRSDERNIFVQAATWADKTMLDKACEWLVDNIYGYVEESQKYSDGYSIDLSSLVSDFRKAMEE